MGMFDEVLCSAKLPGQPPAFVVATGFRFQTKDLDCELATYEITEDGRLVCRDGGWLEEDGKGPVDFTGDLEFYQSNWVAVSNGIDFTRDGEDYESVTYTARFIDGRLQQIVETWRERKPALPQSDLHFGKSKPTAEDVARFLERRAESLVGRQMFLLLGGKEPSEGEHVEVIAEGPHAWVLRFPDGDFRIEHRAMRDHLLFDSFEAAATHYAEQKAQRDRESEYYVAKLKAKESPS